MTKVARLCKLQLYAKNFDQQLDQIPFLLGVQNGVVDLRTGTLRARTREDMISILTPTKYDHIADTSFIEQTVITLMGGDATKAKQIQRLLGQALTKEDKHNTLIVFTGQGCREKSILTNALCRLLPDTYVDLTYHYTNDILPRARIIYKYSMDKPVTWPKQKVPHHTRILATTRNSYPSSTHSFHFPYIEPLS